MTQKHLIDHCYWVGGNCANCSKGMWCEAYCKKFKCPSPFLDEEYHPERYVPVEIELEMKA